MDRGLAIDNQFETEQTVSLRVVEYQSGFPEDGGDAEVQSVTATPTANDSVERYDSDLPIDAGGYRSVRDVFTLSSEPRKYYLSFESEEVDEREYTFTVTKGVGFSYLYVSLEATPEVVITTE